MKYEVTLQTMEYQRRVSADGLLELMQKFGMLLLELQRREHDKKIEDMTITDDEIPF